ncbi:preprotein translocase subunit SecE [Pseudonocardia endophytica]|uniref:Protein translocase subunit SecE n=1 Tax=Pseudonocardia endophytica TaxID=401976 RepID=A0A4R1HIK6_PSEEN|nr:preprotein translocase subunit SecE [Pseudonocardia endophytica]TCK20285.1 preprotein translocase subunit SecE [Pseudonocardia endophytica]
MTDERDPERSGRERPRTAADRRGQRARRSQQQRDEATGRTAGKGQATPSRSSSATATKASPPARLLRFLREVVAELRKVIWPTRPQMVTYTIAVLVFVSFMVALVFALDSLFAEGVSLLFGN